MTTDAAHIVWLGNNPWSNGTYSDASGQRVIARGDPAFQASIHGQPELVQQARFAAAARAFIREHPGRFLRLCARRLGAFVWFSPNAGALYSPALGLVYRAWYVTLLLAGLWGFARWWSTAPPDRRHAALLLWSSVAALALLHSLIAINMKHRVPLELILSLFAVVPAVHLLKWR
jgi:hypothetical protein